MLSTFLFLPLSFLFSSALTPFLPHLASVACCLPQSGRSGPSPARPQQVCKVLQCSSPHDQTPRVIFLCRRPLCLSEFFALGGHPSCSCLALFTPGWVAVFQRHLLLSFLLLLSTLPEIPASWISQRSLHTSEEPDAQINEAPY